MSTSFKPKQHITLSTADLIELQGDGSQQAIRATLKNYTPAFETASIIHDNACGAGAVTESIMTSEPAPPSGIKIHATDIDANFVAGTKAVVESKGWPVTTAVMDARSVSFTSDFFTHSFTAFAFHCMPEGEKAGKEIYRTLKPGGTAIAMIWTTMPHVRVLQEAHWTTRGRDGPMPAFLPDEPLFTGEDLVNLLKSGGFKEVETHELHIKVRIGNRTGDMERWAQLAWSYLGRLSGPEEWKRDDEAKWDEAIRYITEGLQQDGRTERGADGSVFMKFVASVAVAKK